MDNITMWVPLSIGGRAEDMAKGLRVGDEGFDPRKHMRVFGLVSTDKEDLQGEVTLQGGLDFDDLKWLNDDHIRNTVVGVPERTMFLRANDPTPSGKPAPKTGWYVDAYMLPTARGLELYETAKAIEAAGGPNVMGFSIQGRALKRGNVLERVKVREIAVTSLPVNDDTYLTVEGLVKSMSAGYDAPATGGVPGDAGPLRPESLEGQKMPQPDAPVIEIGKNCRTAAAFDKDRRERGMNEEEYAAGLARSGRLDAYDRARFEDRIEKSLSGLDRRMSATAAAVDAVDAKVDAVQARKSETTDDQKDEDEEKGDEGEGDEKDDDEGEEGEMEKSIAKSMRALGGVVEALAATATKLEAKVDALGSKVDALQSDVEKSLTAANAPLAARGLRSAPQAPAAAAARHGFEAPKPTEGETPDKGKFDVVVMRKSMRAALQAAVAKDDRSALEALGDIATNIDIGQAARAVPVMLQMGLAVV